MSNCATRLSLAYARVLLALLLVYGAEAAPIQWRELAGNRCDSGVARETGYPAPLLNYVWHKYGQAVTIALANYEAFLKIAEVVELPDAIAIMLYVGLWYIHTHPAKSTFGQRDWTHFGRISERKFYDLVLPVLFEFSNRMDEICADDRYHPMNHGTGFCARFITAIVDCCPVNMVEPKDPALCALLMQPKYGCCCYKLQVAVNFFGWIVYYSGPHHGSIGDQVIYNMTYHDHALRSWEYWIGDGIYESCYGCLTRFILNAGQVFTPLQVFMNRCINSYRQRVEHVMHSIKDHAMFSGKKLKCSFPVLDRCLNLTVHLTNAKIKHVWEEEAYRKYPGYNSGPWPAGP